MAKSGPSAEVEVLERGNLYLIYRPKVEEEDVSGPGDVQRFYMVLRPEGKRVYRQFVIGAKRLSEIEDGGERNWGFVDQVTDRPQEIEQDLREQTYETKTRGERRVPAARPVGEGVYAIALKGGDHTHFAFVLELPEDPGKPQEALNIAPEGTFILAIKNPEAGQPRNAGLRRKEKPDLSKDLQDRFRGRRFAPCDPPDFLDHERVEFVLIGAGEDIGETLGIDMPAEDESPETADMLKDLRMARSRHPVEPLFKGEWA